MADFQTTQTTMVGVMEKIQNHVMQDTDQDKTCGVDETPTISKPLPPPVGPLGEKAITSQPSGRTFQEDFEEQLR